LSTIKQFNNGDPIDINTLNQMIAAINSLNIQISQIYNLPSPQSTFVVNNSGPTGSTQANPTGTNVSTKTVLLSIAAGSKQEGWVLFKSSFGKNVVTVTTEMVQKAVGSTIKIKDFTIVGVGNSNLSFLKKVGGSKETATGIKILTTSFGKQFSWQLEKNGLSTYSPGQNAPSTTATGDLNKVYFTWRVDVEVSY
jgi:hypothetical protein